MGQAKRRGTFQQRKEQRIAKQYGLTNQQIAEAYYMNILYDFNQRRNQYNEKINFLSEFLQLFSSTSKWT